MKITKVETYLLKVPTDRVHTDSINVVSYNAAPLVKISTDERIEGWGYSWTLGAGFEFPKEMIDRYMAHMLIGQDPMQRKKIIREMFSTGNFDWDLRLGRNGIGVMAASMVDLALWDILCKKADLPLWKVLGGYKNRVETYNSHVGWSSYNVEELVTNVKRLVNQEGYRGVKLFIGRDNPEADYERIRAVRDAVGNSVKVMIDGNTVYDLETAIRWGRRFDDFNPFWFEEPMEPLDIRAHATLRSKISTPIALGESLYSKYTFREYLAQQAVDILQPDITKIIGITEWMEIASMADAHNINVCPHTNIQQPVHVQLAASVRNSPLVENQPFFLDVWKTPLQPKNGYFEAPEVSGAGTEVKEEAIKKYGV